MNWKTLSTKVIYKNPWIEVREDQVIDPKGTKTIYDYIHIPRTVGVVPLDGDQNIFLCKQYRYLFKDYSWEIPRGFVDKEETPLQAAKRELREEAGLVAKRLIKLGTLRLSVGTVDEEATIFLAQINIIPKNLSHEDEISEVKRFTIKKVLEMINNSHLIDGLTVGAILKAYQFTIRNRKI